MNREDIEQAIYERTRRFVSEDVQDAIIELIAAEREACARMCADLHIEGEDNTGLAADLIRARG